MSAIRNRAISVALAFAAGMLPVTASAATSLTAAAFLRTVDKANTANVVTGDLVHYTGTHVAYECVVENMIKRGLIMGECGSAQEPIGLFIHVPTGRLRLGQRLSILGVMETPAMWTDVAGHTVYYAFVKAMFVDGRAIANSAT